MAQCGGCGAVTSRTRTRFSPQGEVIAEECDSCKPNTFDPQWLHARLAMAHEAYPNLYKKTYDEDGRIVYRSTEEREADLTEMLQRDPEEEDRKKAEERKRRERRKEPMTEAEKNAVLNKWRPAMEAKAKEEIKQREALQRAWLMP
jgi:hypothetical protein